MIEVGKEFDENAAFTHDSFIEPGEVSDYDAYGQNGNVGQPSVVYRVPFHFVGRRAPIAAVAATAAYGYGDWTGVAGDLHPIDAQISAATPGSGVQRLRAGDGPGGTGLVHVDEIACTPLDCATAPPPDAPRIDEPKLMQPATSATFTFRQSSDSGAPVITYELRYAIAPDPLKGADESLFSQWTPVPPPAVDAPGTISQAEVDGLLPQTAYSIGLRARGACGWSAPSFARVITGKRPLHPALRLRDRDGRLRQRARPRRRRAAPRARPGGAAVGPGRAGGAALRAHRAAAGPAGRAIGHRAHGRARAAAADHDRQPRGKRCACAA